MENAFFRYDLPGNRVRDPEHLVPPQLVGPQELAERAPLVIGRRQPELDVEALAPSMCPHEAQQIRDPLVVLKQPEHLALGQPGLPVPQREHLDGQQARVGPTPGQPHSAEAAHGLALQQLEG